MPACSIASRHVIYWSLYFCLFRFKFFPFSSIINFSSFFYSFIYMLTSFSFPNMYQTIYLLSFFLNNIFLPLFFTSPSPEHAKSGAEARREHDAAGSSAREDGKRKEVATLSLRFHTGGDLLPKLRERVRGREGEHRERTERAPSER